MDGSKTTITLKELRELQSRDKGSKNEAFFKDNAIQKAEKEKGTVYLSSNKLTFSVEDLPALGAEDSGEVYQGHSVLSRQLTKATTSSVCLGKNNTMPVQIKMLDYNSEEVKKPLTQFESAVQQALYSLLDDGFLCVTGAQIYRKMKGNKKSHPTQEQKGVKDIDLAMKKLSAITVEISVEESQDGEVRTLGDIIKIEDAEKTCALSDTLASFIEQRTEVFGNTATAYVMRPILDPETKTYDPRPLIQRMEVALNQFEKVPDELLAITKINDKGQEIEMRLTKERIAIRHYISDLVFMVRRIKVTAKNYSNKRSYDDIFEQCDITSGSHKKNQGRYKEFIKDCLDFYVRKEVISGWAEYMNKGKKKPSGIEVYA